VVRANSGRYSSSVESDVSGWQALTIALLLSLYAACVGSGRRILAVHVRLAGGRWAIPD
jgi:hypothetical protein